MKKKRTKGNGNCHLNTNQILITCSNLAPLIPVRPFLHPEGTPTEMKNYVRYIATGCFLSTMMMMLLRPL